MPDIITPENDPKAALPNTLDAPRPGEDIKADLHRASIRAIVNLIKHIKDGVDAARFGGKLPTDFWQKTDTLPGGGTTANADLLDGYDSTAFYKKTDPVDAARLGGRLPSAYALAGWPDVAHHEFSVMGRGEIPEGQMGNLARFSFPRPPGTTRALIKYFKYEFQGLPDVLTPHLVTQDAPNGVSVENTGIFDAIDRYEDPAENTRGIGLYCGERQTLTNGALIMTPTYDITVNLRNTAGGPIAIQGMRLDISLMVKFV